jgi:hypothetical protein
MWSTVVKSSFEKFQNWMGKINIVVKKYVVS